MPGRTRSGRRRAGALCLLGGAACLSRHLLTHPHGDHGHGRLLPQRHLVSPGLPTYELTVTAGGPVDSQFRGLADFTDPSGATTRDYRTTLGGGTWVQTIHGSAWDDGWTLQVDRTNAAAAASTRDTRPLSCEVTIRVPGGPVLHVTDATNEPSGTATCSALQAPRAARAYTPAAPPAATQARTRQPSYGGIQGCNVAPQNYSAQWRAAVRSGSVPE